MRAQLTIEPCQARGAVLRQACLRLQIVVVSVVLHCGTAAGQVQFEDVTEGSGVEYSGESYGGAWGDANGDRLPDLVVPHHRYPSGLYVNLADGTFEDRGHLVDAWQLTPRSDEHGAAWADYNNDGRQDLVITAGSKNFTQFLVNDGVALSDHITDFTFDRREWGGRFPFWFDYDNDGLLDLAMVVQDQKIILHKQVGNDFLRRNAASGHQCTNGDFSLLTDLTMDGFPDWLCVNASALPERIYDTSAGTPFIDRSALSDKVGNINDVALADFDGDQVMDIFALRGKVRVNGAEIVAPKAIEAHLTNSGATESGISFRTTGSLSIELHWSGANVGRVFIGAGGRHPPAAQQGQPIRINLSPSDSTVVGMVPHDPATDRGVYIGYQPATQTWSYFNSAGSGGGGSFSYTYSYIDGTAAVSNLQLFGISASERPLQPALLQNSGTRYTNQIAGTGLDHAVLCNSVVTADVDNDMDTDLYYVCRAAVSNLPNRLYLNDGTGNFVAAAAPFGAEGQTGPGVGVGESVISSDYDVDGFVDLFVTNGLHLYPELRGFSSGGPDKLFHNLGNTNRWLELDLHGTVSNRDGLGASVVVTAGGKSQRREQNGGYHRWAQNDRRLHFGLGTNNSARISVRWPSGTVNNYSNVPANRLYEVIEGNPVLVPIDVPTSTPPSECEPTVGMPAYDPAADRALFIWRQTCSSQRWNVRVTGGAGPTLVYSGGVESTQPLTAVAPVGLEAIDQLTPAAGDTSLSYALSVGSARQDGFTFTIDASANSCFGVGANTATALVGPDRIPRSLPFDLRTLEPCAP